MVIFYHFQNGSNIYENRKYFFSYQYEMGNFFSSGRGTDEENLGGGDGDKIEDVAGGDTSGFWGDKVQGCLRKYKTIDGKVMEAVNYKENDQGQPINSLGQKIDISAMSGSDACDFREVAADTRIVKDSKFSSCTEGGDISTVFSFSGKA